MPKTLSVTSVTTIGTFDGFEIVTVKVTWPPGSWTEVGFAVFTIPIAPWPWIWGGQLFVIMPESVTGVAQSEST